MTQPRPCRDSHSAFWHGTATPAPTRASKPAYRQQAAASPATGRRSDEVHRTPARGSRLLDFGGGSLFRGRGTSRGRRPLPVRVGALRLGCRRCVFSMDMRGRWPGSSTSAGALRNPPDSSWAGPLGVDLDGILRGRGSKRCETHTVFRPYNGHSRMSSNESSVMSLVV